MFNFLKKKEIIPEVLQNWINQLPDQIQVSWFKENDFIVGEILLDGVTKIYTQARNPEEFVVMVNDVIYTSLITDKVYRREILKMTPYFSPTEKAWTALRGGKRDEFKAERQLIVA